MSDGVLSDRELRQAVRDGWIVAPTAVEDQQFQPASLDLRLGPDAYQLRASFLPFRESVQSRLGEHGLAESDLVIDQLSLAGAGATLQRGSVYLVPLLESLALPPDVRGRSTAVGPIVCSAQFWNVSIGVCGACPLSFASIRRAWRPASPSSRSPEVLLSTRSSSIAVPRGLPSFTSSRAVS